MSNDIEVIAMPSLLFSTTPGWLGPNATDCYCDGSGTLPPTSNITVPNPESTDCGCSGSGGQSAASIASKVGLAVGVVVVLFFLCFWFTYLCCRGRRKDANAALSDPPNPLANASVYHSITSRPELIVGV